MQRDSIVNTFVVAGLLCGVCSLMVSGAAVGLRNTQRTNKELDKKRNVLVIAGLIGPKERPSEAEIDDKFQQIEVQVVDLRDKENARYAIDVDPATFDQRKAEKDPAQSRVLEQDEDVANIKRREHYATVYRVMVNGKMDQIVLPIKGYGLWSILYGFVSIDSDLMTIRGIGFYEHGETPGLGGEVDNQKWKDLWKNGKKAFDAEGNVQIEVIKGVVGANTKEPEHKVDGLSGATFTSNGVTNMLRYWLGPDGFGPYLDRLRRKRGDQ